MLLLVFIINRLHEHNFCTNVLCDLLNLEFPEMGGLDLELSPGDGNDAVLGRLDAFPDLLAFTHVDLHGYLLHATIASNAHESCAADRAALVYQLVYVGLYLSLVIGLYTDDHEKPV